MPQQNNMSGWMVVVLGVVALALLGNLFSGGDSSSPPPVNRNSVEHRYATERLRQEGYSGTEAQQAADAIIRFHEAQKNR